MTTGQVIAKRRLELGWTQEQLAQKMGYTSKSSINKIELDKVDLPQRKIKLFADVLGLNVGDLFPDVPKEKIGLSNLYKADNLTLTIPFISQKLSAGTGVDILSDEDIDVKTIDIAAFMAKGIDKNTLLAAEVVGDSMIDANIFPGDIVVFSKGLVQAEGIYVVSFAGEVLVKRIEFDPLENKILIISENPKYKQRIIDADNENFRLLGKVVGWIHYEY